MMEENILIKDMHILLYDEKDITNPEFDYLKKNFCGVVKTEIDDNSSLSNKIIYLCGDISKIYNMI